MAIVGGRLITSEDSPLVCRWNDGNKEVGVWKRGWKSREWGWSGGVERCTRRGSKRLRREGGGGRRQGEESARGCGGGPLGMMIGSRFRSRAFAGLDSVSAGWPVMRSSLHRAITLPRDPEFRRKGTERGRDRERERNNRILIEIDQSEWKGSMFDVWNFQMMASVRIEF